MKRNLVYMAAILGFLICTGNSFAEDDERSLDSNISAELEKFNVTRINDSNITRRLLEAVPGVDGRIIRQEPAKAVPGVEGGIVAQDTPTATITTEPPTTPPPEPEEKAACGPTTMLALAILPLLLKRKNK